MSPPITCCIGGLLLLELLDFVIQGISVSTLLYVYHRDTHIAEFSPCAIYAEGHMTLSALAHRGGFHGIHGNLLTCAVLKGYSTRSEGHIWLCVCDCWNRVKVEGRLLRSGLVQSCQHCGDQNFQPDWRSLQFWRIASRDMT